MLFLAGWSRRSGSKREGCLFFGHRLPLFCAGEGRRAAGGAVYTAQRKLSERVDSLVPPA